MADATPLNLPLNFFTLLGIDGGSIGNTELLTSVAGQAWVFIGAIFAPVSATAVTIPPTVSIGQNSATYNDVLAATTLTGLTSSNQTLFVPVLTAARYVPSSAGTVFNVRVSTAATAAAYSFNVTVVAVERSFF